MEQTIGDYRIVRLLGKGGMGEVYEVENPRVGSRLALKVFTAVKGDPDLRRRFETEARLLAHLSHPNIVKVVDLGTDEATGRPYFAMDLVLDSQGEPRSLAALAPGEADEEQIGRWYDDIRAGLAYIHAQGVIHRDLKLENILIGADGRAVLSDFGISKISDHPGEEHAAIDKVDTILQVHEGRTLVMGSLGYLAPELEMGVAASAASDWYALGVIVYRLLTGTWCEARTDIAGSLATYDPVWRRILPKLLHTNPNGRECPSYAEEKARDRVRAEDAVDARLRTMTRRVRGLTAALAVLAVCAVGALFLHREQPSASVPTANLPTFDDLFEIPPTAPAEDDAPDGTISRERFEQALVDALVLSYESFVDLKNGNISLAKLGTELEKWKENPPTEGPGDYYPSTESEALAVLASNAVEKIKIQWSGAHIQK